MTSIGAYYINGSFTRAGTPDLIFCLKGKFIAIEVKDPLTGRVAPLQLAHIDLIHKSGGMAFVACSTDEVITYLTSYGILPNSDYDV